MNTTLEKLIGPVLEDMGYELVRLKLSLSQSSHLQVMAERKDRADMKVEDCEAISHALSPLLDVEDVIKSRYTLEVSSPGLDRPLVKPGDYTRFAGEEAKVETSVAVDGCKRFIGRLLGIAEGQVEMEVDREKVRIPYDLIAKAKLVLTDGKMRELMNNSKKKEVNNG